MPQDAELDRLKSVRDLAFQAKQCAYAMDAASSGEFGFRCRFRGFDALVESSYSSKDGRAKIDIYYGPHGPLGPGHHHAVAYRDSPFTFVYDEYRSKM